MADTRVQIEIEDWVRRDWLPTELGQPMFSERLPLSAGGVFAFDAVSADHSIAAVISTSSCLTSSGKLAVGKLMKIRSDVLFLMMTGCEQRFVVLTDRSMYDRVVKEKADGRLPREIQVLHAPLPSELGVRLAQSQKVASEEVRPRSKE